MKTAKRIEDSFLELVEDDPKVQIYPPKIQTIEATSKIWKALQLVGCGVVLIGLLILGIGWSGDSPNTSGWACWFMGMGISVILLAKTFAWWENG
jgi:hypothetical protein